MVLVGHSMGGAIAARVAASNVTLHQTLMSYVDCCRVSSSGRNMFKGIAP